MTDAWLEVVQVMVLLKVEAGYWFFVSEVCVFLSFVYFFYSLHILYWLVRIMVRQS